MDKTMPRIWLMITYDDMFYPIEASAQCKPEDHGRLNPHVKEIQDVDGAVLWSRPQSEGAE